MFGTSLKLLRTGATISGLAFLTACSNMANLASVQDRALITSEDLAPPNGTKASPPPKSLLRGWAASIEEKDAAKQKKLAETMKNLRDNIKPAASSASTATTTAPKPDAQLPVAAPTPVTEPAGVAASPPDKSDSDLNKLPPLPVHKKVEVTPLPPTQGDTTTAWGSAYDAVSNPPVANIPPPAPTADKNNNFPIIPLATTLIGGMLLWWARQNKKEITLPKLGRTQSTEPTVKKPDQKQAVGATVETAPESIVFSGQTAQPSQPEPKQPTFSQQDLDRLKEFHNSLNHDKESAYKSGLVDKNNLQAGVHIWQSDRATGKPSKEKLACAVTPAGVDGYGTDDMAIALRAQVQTFGNKIIMDVADAKDVDLVAQMEATIQKMLDDPKAKLIGPDQKPVTSITLNGKVIKPTGLVARPTTPATKAEPLVLAAG